TKCFAVIRLLFLRKFANLISRIQKREWSKMKQETQEMFKILTELQGASGDESRVRSCMEKELGKYSDKLIYDNLGGVFGVKQGEDTHVMVDAQMDQVGIMINQITENGMLRFQPLGGWRNQILLAQRVQIMNENGPITGVIGSIPPHNLTAADRAKPMEIKNMLID